MRPKLSRLRLSGARPATPTCSRNCPSLVNFRACESAAPLPPTQTLSMWSTVMPWFDDGQS